MLINVGKAGDAPTDAIDSHQEHIMEAPTCKADGSRFGIRVRDTGLSHLKPQDYPTGGGCVARLH